MDSFFKLNNLKKAKPEHTIFFKSLWEKPNFTDLILDYTKKNKKKVERFYITNLRFKQPVNVGYLVEINNQSIVLMEEVNNQLCQYQYNFKKNNLLSNQVDLGEVVLNQFLKRFQDIVSDIDSDISEVYEHKQT